MAFLIAAPIGIVGLDVRTRLLDSPAVGTMPGAVFSARHAGLRSGGMGTVSDDIERCESMAEDRW